MNGFNYNYLDMDIGNTRNLMESVWNDKRVDYICEWFDPNVIVESPVRSASGIRSLQQIFQFWFRAFPNIHYKEKAILLNDNEIIISWSAQGEHLGEFYSIAATGNMINFEATTHLFIVNKKVVHYHTVINIQDILNQLIQSSISMISDSSNQRLYIIINKQLRINLSTRQLSCVALSCLNMSVKEIASELLIQDSSVQTHLKRAFLTMGITNRKMLISYAINNQVIDILVRIGLSILKD